MRILFVSHRYPPDGTAGVETYVETVARAVQARGHDVLVLTAVKDIARRDMSIDRRSRAGVQVAEIVNNLFQERFEETWSSAPIDALCAAILDEFQPDVVHVHHLMYLSIGLLDACRERGVPVAWTLHDFWIGCARFGQLLHADGTRCERVDPERCATCLPSFDWRQSDAARRVGKAVALVKSAMWIDLSGPLERVHRQRQSTENKPFEHEAGGTLADSEAALFRRIVPERTSAMLSVVSRSVARVILPSRFQEDWFAELGVERSRMEVVRTGLDWSRLGGEVKRVPPAGHVRFLFLGTLVPHKGAHVLLDAWEQLDPQVRSRATLRIHGPQSSQPAYVTRLAERANGLELEIGDRLDREGVARVLSESDVLVVPSLWLEVRPLVMVEAFAAGLRVIASDLGGMAEVIEDGVPGRTFAPGDAGALAQAMAAEVEGFASAPAVTPCPSPAFPAWDTAVDRILTISEEIRT